MSQAESDPMPQGPGEEDPVALSELASQVEGGAKDPVPESLAGQALEEALAEAASQVAADALVEAGNRRRSKPRPKEMRIASALSWRSIDTSLGLVLLANLLFMGLVFLLPEPPSEPSSPPQPPEAGRSLPQPVRQDQKPKELPGIESRVVQLARIEGLIRLGKFEEAIQKIEASLKANPDLPPMIRRTLYSRLANYCAEAGQHDKALRYLKLSSNGFQMSLLPKDLWKMATDATRLGDHSGARKYLARFLLQESLMDEEMQNRVPKAYLLLGDGYRIQASETRHGSSPKEPEKGGEREKPGEKR